MQHKHEQESSSGLKVGSKAPFFKVKDAESNYFSLEEMLSNGPVVLIFYRGQWCPVCNKHLSELQDSLHLITSRGVQVAAISPEKPEYLKIMEKKTGASYSLLYDENYKIAEAYDVAFKPSASAKLLYNTVLNANLNEAHASDDPLLPIPATYIINNQGIIVWKHIDPDYKKRASVRVIMENLPD